LPRHRDPVDEGLAGYIREGLLGKIVSGGGIWKQSSTFDQIGNFKLLQAACVR
jgi:hypothetical protein